MPLAVAESQAIDEPLRDDGSCDVTTFGRAMTFAWAHPVMRMFVVVLVLSALTGCPADETQASDPKKVGVLVERCLGSNRIGHATDQFSGLSEKKAHEKAEAQGLEVRVLGREKECFDRTDDQRDNRLNILLVDGAVVWADRF